MKHKTEDYKLSAVNYYNNNNVRKPSTRKCKQKNIKNELYIL